MCYKIRLAGYKIQHFRKKKKVKPGAFAHCIMDRARGLRCTWAQLSGTGAIPSVSVFAPVAKGQGVLAGEGGLSTWVCSGIRQTRRNKDLILPAWCYPAWHWLRGAEQVLPAPGTHPTEPLGLFQNSVSKGQWHRHSLRLFFSCGLASGAN